MEEKIRTVTMKGKPLTLLGKEIKVGQKAPDFEVHANDLTKVSLASFRDQTLVILSVPSLDTSVCDTMTRRFNQEAVSLGEDVNVIVISMDLPFAQKRWCGAAGVKNVMALSDHYDANFGKAYGVLIKELRLLARAVFVVDKDSTIKYIQLVGEISQEPDYKAAIDAVKNLLQAQTV